ncbi:Gas vesicle synthesis protein GvpL/GvpF [Halogranum amylolyticum]|uniref:Gas vesicle synthesis protein GvpL/GvpF n=1 Tax=Halogranum amylolyticum TaxID=660520 RepID=A0A1H8P2D4_9EURY|nr:GvpL/GvpF family gas vesicle protein [Halogranum amylolyticum]SEO36099.1 Gas vesicle synthesis protein GvpL/GvpF [Halogranum amylolyticum]
MSEPETSFDEGRYLYCVVTDGDGSLSTTGLEDEQVRVIREAGLVAVVHDCSSLYDSDSATEIQRWILAHQSVVDDAGEAFGTPLPFQFDTIVRGDDEAVRSWLREEEATLTDHLEALAGRWEYRIEVVWDEDAAREELEAADDELQQLAERRDSADEGTGFLLNKQYETRLDQLLSEQRRAEAADLAERIGSEVTELVDLGERSTVGLDVGGADEEVDVLARFAVLATDDEQEAVGLLLDDVAADPGIEVRFTGPWPPYTFTPELGEEGPDASDEV